MKKILLLIIISTFSFSEANYWDQDDNSPFFQQRDNQAHIAINTLISGTVTYYGKNVIGLSDSESFLLGLASGLAFGFIKEKYYDDNFDNEDMKSWALGSVIGSTFVITVF